jgi:hypothetical protein
MASTKKSKARRRAAKHAAAAAFRKKEEEDAAEVEMQVEGRLRLQIGDFVRVGKSCGCRHGFTRDNRFAREIHNFLHVFANGYNARYQICDGFYGVLSNDAYARVWSSCYKIEQALSYCLSIGTEYFLDQDKDRARTYAFLAYFLEQLCIYQRTGVTPNLTWRGLGAMCEDASALPLLADFFGKRIPCSCLGDEYDGCKLNVAESDGEEQKEPQSTSGQEIEPTITIDERGRVHVGFALAIVDEKYAPLRQMNDGLYEFVKSQGEEAEKVAHLEEDTAFPVETEKQVRGEAAFELDQLSRYDLPASFVPHRYITSWSRGDFGVSEGGRCWHSKAASVRRELYLQACKFDLAFTDAYNAAGGVLNHKMIAAYHATRDEYVDVWNSQAAMKFISLHLLSAGTDCLLEGDTKAASHHASIAYCFDQHVACNLRKDRPTMNWPKMNELYFDPDEHTLVSFFKKRISCSCLDDMYEQVKSVKKLGICYNINCPLPDRKAERKIMTPCLLCRRVNYCSRECQEDNWQLHKKYCCGYIQRDSTVVSATTYNESNT